jgi:hypothetical protein
MFSATNNIPFKAQRGIHSFVANVTTGPVVLEVSDDSGATFQNMTDGSFAADEDGMIVFADDLQYRAQIPGGDSIVFAPADTSIQTDPRDV